MQAAWKSERGRVYRWARADRRGAVSMLEGQDGTCTANVVDIDAELRAAWRPICRRYAG